MADISWEDGEDVAWEDGEDVAWDDTPSQDLDSKPIEGLGKEQSFLQRAEEASTQPLPEASLGQRMADVTPDKVLKAGAVGLEEAIPAPTTALAAGISSAMESLSQGRPQRPEDIQAEYNRMKAEKEAVKSAAPGIAEFTEGAVGLALPTPGFAVKPLKSAGDTIGPMAQSLARSAQASAVGATKATPKQLEKINRYNPDLGKFLLDEQIVSAGKSVKGMQKATAGKLKESEQALSKIYEGIDGVTGGKTVGVDRIIGKLEEATASLSRVHANDATREAIDKEIELLRTRYPDGTISAREAQELKSAYGQTGYGQSVLPGTRNAHIDRKISRAYKVALDDAATESAPEFAEMLAKENKRASNLKAANAILAGKKPPEMSPVEVVAGIGGSFANPAAAAVPLLSQQLRSRGGATYAAGKQALADTAGTVQALLSNPETGPIVDAAIKAVGLPTVTQIINTYGEDDPRTRSLLTRLASRGE